jgi:hypothetical protein
MSYRDRYPVLLWEFPHTPEGPTAPRSGQPVELRRRSRRKKRGRRRRKIEEEREESDEKDVVGENGGE